MAETSKCAHDGCGLVGAIFRRRRPAPTISSEPPSIPRSKITPIRFLTGSSNSKRQRAGSSGENEMAITDGSKPPLPKLAKKPPRKQSLDDSLMTSIAYDKSLPQRRPKTKENYKNSVSFYNNKSGFISSGMISNSQVANFEYTQRLRREPTFKSGELSVTSQRLSNASNTGERLYKASAGSVMLLGELGNLKNKENKQSSSSKGGNNGKSGGKVPAMGNILRSNSYVKGKNGFMNKVDPDLLKSLGNEKYKEGKFEEALALYNRAIALDPTKASFYSNKSAALMSLGHLMEAVFECTEAICLEPTYHNAHYRMARLYIRLGEADKAMCHFLQSGRKTRSKDISQAEILEAKMAKCFGAREQNDWNALFKETRDAINYGADSAPQIYAMQAEALMELRRHEGAYKVIEEGPSIDIELCTKFLGPSETAKIMIIRSKIYMMIGRFDAAVAAAKHAAEVNSSEEVNSVLKRVNSVALARITGNKLFNKARFSEASLVYTSALEEEPCNSVLLCNRAACRSKLGQHEKAVEDCTAALTVRPSYSKARLRRADSHAKMERWEAALKDYEILMQEVPGDEEVAKGFAEASEQVKKQHKNEIEKALRRSAGLKAALENEHLDDIVTAAEYYGSSSSFKKTRALEASSRTNCAAIEYSRPVTTLQEIFTH